ncbi:MAG: helix-turn-helix domain-containing protein [Lachnospiraceae bacterium]|nr:helix-turn-helix domain-containing protein [Lachnospiraceae bacterium]
MEQEEKWVSMEEICNHLGSSRDTIKKMIKTQQLPAYKIDRKWKFKISEVDSWMHERNKVTDTE